MATIARNNKLIILDRDGVINETGEAVINSADLWRPIAGSLDAIAFLTQAGYSVVVASNQSGIGRGVISMQNLNEIHTKMHELVQKAGGRIDGIWFCPHTTQADCNCRKPKTGMLEDILDRLNMEPSHTWLVGDSLRDMQAIEALGGNPVLVLTGKGKHTLAAEGLSEDVQVFEDLLTFAQYRIQQDTELAKGDA